MKRFLFVQLFLVASINGVVGQSSQDTIRILRFPGGQRFFVGEERYKSSDLQHLLYNNEQAYDA